MIFDNLRVLHARNAFDNNSGHRWLRGCYVDGQDVASKEMSMSEIIQEMDVDKNKKSQTNFRRINREGRLQKV